MATTDDRPAGMLSKGLGWILAILAPVYAWTVVRAPIDSVQGVMQKILYVHPPLAYGAYLGFVVTAIAGLLVSLLFPEGGDDGLFTYETVHPDRGFVWALLLLAGVNIVATVVPAVLASLVLVPARGWRWVTAGAVLAVVAAMSSGADELRLAAITADWTTLTAEAAEHLEV